MDRRTYLGSAGSFLAVGIAGCLGRSYDGEAANEFGYETTETADVDVPLAPIADVREWHEADAALFVDARGETAYERARIAGAVHSPAPEGTESNDPVADVSTDRRILTYCTCPHHLSTLRAASLIGDDYEHAYALDEGFDPWQDNGYPMAGEDVETDPGAHRIVGRTDPAHAGAYAWAWHDATGQREAAPIGEAGAFALTLHFYDLRPDSKIRLATPGGEVTDELQALTAGRVRL